MLVYSSKPTSDKYIYSSRLDSREFNQDYFRDESLLSAEKWLLNRKLNSVRSLTAMMAGVRLDMDRTGVHIVVGQGGTSVLERALPNLTRNILDPGRSCTLYLSVSDAESAHLRGMLKRNRIPVKRGIEGSRVLDAKIMVQPHTAKAPAMHKTLKHILNEAVQYDRLLAHEFIFADVETEYLQLSKSNETRPKRIEHGALQALRAERRQYDYAFISTPWVLGTGIGRHPEKPTDFNWASYDQIERLMLDGNFGALWGGSTVGDTELLLPLGIVATEDPGIVTEDILISVFASLLGYRWGSSTQIGGFNTARPGTTTEISDQMKRWIKASADLEILFGQEVTTIMPYLWSNQAIARMILDPHVQKNFLKEIDEAYKSDWYEVRERFISENPGWTR